MNVKGIHHCEILVTDLERALHFYKETLGLNEIHNPATFSGSRWLQLGKQQLHLTYHPGEHASNIRHFAIEVDNLEEHKNQLKKSSVTIHDAVSIPGVKRFFIYDPFGNRIEFVELANCMLNQNELTMNLAKDIFLSGDQVDLKPMRTSHLNGLYAVGKESTIWQWMSRDKFSSKQDVENWIQEAISKYNEIPFTIFHKTDQKIIGNTRFINIDPNNKSLEIGYSWLHPDYWHSGVNVECKYLLLDYIFETLKYNRAQLKTDIRNIRSQKAIEKLGATKEGVLRSNRIIKNGYRRDCVYYSILLEEWPAIKSHLINI